MTTLRVAMLIDHIAGGGAERFVADLAGALARRGASVTLCVSRAEPSDDVLAAIAARGVEPLALGRSGRVQPRRWRPLLRLLRSGRVDVLNSHLHSSNVYGAILSAASGVPLVATEHGSTADGHPVRSALDRRIVASRARFVVAASDHTGARLLARGWRPGSLRVIRPAPAATTGPRRSQADARRALGLPVAAGAVIGTICAVRHEKRLDVLIDAAALVARSRPCHLVIVGDGPERRQAEDHARRAGLNSVTLTGWRDDPSALVPAFDVFALSSDTEGTPMALIEAMRAGVPVAATGVGGVPAAAPDGECALLVPRRDPAALAGAIERLLDEPELASRLARRAAEHAETAHSLERAADEWLQVLAEAAADRPPAGGRRR
jgi:glycosyltransferase involved in cell wall biosynthesis